MLQPKKGAEQQRPAFPIVISRLVTLRFGALLNQNPRAVCCPALGFSGRWPAADFPRQQGREETGDGEDREGKKGERNLLLVLRIVVTMAYDNKGERERERENGSSAPRLLGMARK